MLENKFKKINYLINEKKFESNLTKQSDLFNTCFDILLCNVQH